MLNYKSAIRDPRCAFCYFVCFGIYASKYLRLGSQECIGLLLVLGVGVENSRFEIVVVSRNRRWQQQA